jgi:hypothetical protein
MIAGLLNLQTKTTGDVWFENDNAIRPGAIAPPAFAIASARRAPLKRGVNAKTSLLLYVDEPPRRKRRGIKRKIFYTRPKGPGNYTREGLKDLDAQIRSLSYRERVRVRGVYPSYSGIAAEALF